MEENNMLARALLGMQNALLGAVDHSLRAVKVNVDEKNKILFYFFYYNGEVTDKLFDLASVACAEASAHFPEYMVEEKLERLDYPAKIPSNGTFAYLRRE